MPRLLTSVRVQRLFTVTSRKNGWVGSTPSVLVLLFPILVSRCVNAAEISRELTRDGMYELTLAGEIVEGDAKALSAQIESTSINLAHSIELNSVGGSLHEAIAIALVIRKNILSTKVAAGNTCVSACFIAFVSGVTKSSEVRST